jgi:hypothetical protein
MSKIINIRNHDIRYENRNNELSDQALIWTVDSNRSFGDRNQVNNATRMLIDMRNCDAIAAIEPSSDLDH